ncbi:MAG: extracellular solute-binding protein [Clostridia bacterium]|nr:extracellular solute-binding protein [Clostridia bacterium]
MRKLSVLLVAVMLISCLSGLSALAEENPPITIEYWNINNESFGGPANAVMIEKFNQTNDKNITVVDVHYSDYMAVAQSLQASLAAGEYPGVVQVGYSTLNYFAENFPQFTDPTTIISEYCPEDADYLDSKYAPSVQSLGIAANGRMLGMPYAFSVPLLFYNADLFREAGLDPDDPPTTWEEAYEMGKVIREKTGKPALFIQTPADTYSIIPIFMSAGVDNMYVANEGGGYHTTFNTEESVYAWQLIQDMTRDGVNVYMTHEEGTGAYVGQQVAMYLTTSARASYMANNTDFDSRAALQPTFEGNELKVSIGGNMLVTVARSDAQVKACWEFIKFLLEPEQVDTWVRGTGYLPPTKDAADDETDPLYPYFAEAPMLQLALTEQAYASPWTSWPGMNGLMVDQYLIDLRDRITTSSYEDVASVISETASIIDSLIQSESTRLRVPAQNARDPS